MDLPVYRIIIPEALDESAQVTFVSIVPNPAIEADFMAFSKELKFSINEDQRIISGPLMLADTPIQRYNSKMGEYLIVFDRENIMNMVQKFFRQGFQNNVNLFHDQSQQPGGITMFESFVTDSNRGIKPMQGYEFAKDGSWFGSFKVNNSEVWDRIKSGELKGFSIEGMFQLEPEPPADSGDIMQIIEAIIKQSPDKASAIDAIRSLINEYC